MLDEQIVHQDNSRPWQFSCPWVQDNPRSIRPPSIRCPFDHFCKWKWNLGRKPFHRQLQWWFDRKFWHCWETLWESHAWSKCCSKKSNPCKIPRLKQKNWKIWKIEKKLVKMKDIFLCRWNYKYIKFVKVCLHSSEILQLRNPSSIWRVFFFNFEKQKKVVKMKGA